MNIKFPLAFFLVVCLLHEALAQCVSSDEKSIQCLSCINALSCDETGNTLYEATCGGTMVCNPGPNAAPCKDLAEATTDECGCKDPSDGTTDLEGTFVDSYGSSAYYECSGGMPTYKTCPENYFFSVNDNGCVELPSCQGKLDGQYPIEGNCGSYLECKSNPLTGTKASLGQCMAPSIFNFAIQGCEMTFNCKEMTDGVGEYQDTHKCDMFRTCLDDPVVDEYNTAHCCAPGKVYDSDSNTCVINEGTNCDSNNWIACMEEKYENEICNRCEGKQQSDRFPTWLTCTDLYWECEYNTDGDLKAVLKSCAADTYYIGSSDLCEYVDSHPECTSKTLVGIDKFLANL